MKDKPQEIRWIIYCLAALILMNVVSLVILLFQNDAIFHALVTGLSTRLPTISVENVKDVVQEMLLRRNLFHIVVIIAWSVLAFMVYRRYRLARILLTLFTLLSFIGSIYAFSTTQFLPLQILAILGWAGRIFLIWLLFIPKASQEHFARTP